MTERSVQIWFQNRCVKCLVLPVAVTNTDPPARRAKIKNLAKKTTDTGEDSDAIPDSMRKYLAMQAMENGKPFGREFPQFGGMTGFGSGMFMDTPASKIGELHGRRRLRNDKSDTSKAITHLTCKSLSIGSWRRIGQSAMDLLVFYSPAKSCITYYINADSSGFKIEYPFSFIKSITLDSGDVSNNAEGASQSGGLTVELTRPPLFSMDPGSGGFFQCRDFTEGQQASQILTHRLGGHPKVLSGQLAKLVSLESFRNRHQPLEQTAFTMPPQQAGFHIQRPASQPNHVVHPHAPVLQERAQVMGPPPPRGHKRQRSRSVPAAIDFSQFRHRQPVPSFLFQQEIPAPMPTIHQHMPAQIFAPIPQPATMELQDQSGLFDSFGPSLSIDTSVSFLDFQGRALSTTTANSPPDFDQSFFSSAPESDAFSTQALQTPYQMSFLSPMGDVSGNMQRSISPLSAHGHMEPMIANQSPPLSAMNRSASADLFSMSQDQPSYGDDFLNFNELYSKQTFQLPFRDSLGPATLDDFDFNNLSSFSMDPSELSPENSGFSN